MSDMIEFALSPTTRATPVVGSTKVYRCDGSQVLFTRGKGGLVFDERGRDYLDFACGVGGVVLGHSDDEFNLAMYGAISDGLSFPGYGAVHDQFAQLLLTETKDVSLVSYFKTSSEAVNAAVRLSVAELGRAGIIRCGYTGQGDWQMAGNPGWHEPLHSPFRRRIRHVPGCRGIHGAEAVFDWVDLELQSLEALIQQNRQMLGVLILDAYQFELTEPQTVIEGIKLCRRNGLIVVLDETKTAGRIGPRGSWEMELATLVEYTVLGKAIGNGAALSILLGPADRESLYKVIKVGGTHSKETFGTHAGLHTAQLMRQRGGYALLADIGLEVIDAFNAAAAAAGVDGAVTAVPMLGGRLFEFAFSAQVLGDEKIRKCLVACFLEKGIIALEGHCSFVSLAHAGTSDLLKLRAGQAFLAWRNLLLESH